MTGSLGLYPAVVGRVIRMDYMGALNAKLRSSALKF